MNIQERLAKVHFFTVSPDLSSLAPQERQALSHCINAAKVITDIYLKQAYTENPRIYRELKKRTDSDGIDLLRYFEIHGTPWDAYDHDVPFMPDVPIRPKFGSFYPEGLTTEEWDEWLKTHPTDREKFESPYTVIKRGKKGLRATAYAREYQSHLEHAAHELREAARLLSEGNLKTFLNLRADAFFSNDYFESELTWIDTDGHPFEVTIGPYEVYFDQLLGRKAAFETFVAIPDKDATAALGKFLPLLPEFDRLLSQEFNFSPKGTATPLEVVEDVIRGGESAFGYMFVAYNLPNDRRVHDLKGSKKVFSRTMMQAKFDALLGPTAERVLSPKDLDMCTFENRLLFILGHELSHGLGPSTVKIGDRDVLFEVMLRDIHSALEEAKADMLGVRLLNFFRKRGLLSDAALAGLITTELAAHLNSWTKGFTEAHAQGHLVQYNWLRHYDTLRYDRRRKVFDIDAEATCSAMERLSTEFLKLQQAGDYVQAKAFMKQWGQVAPELPEVLERLSDLPLEVHPIYTPKI